MNFHLDLRNCRFDVTVGEAIDMPDSARVTSRVQADINVIPAETQHRIDAIIQREESVDRARNQKYFLVLLAVLAVAGLAIAGIAGHAVFPVSFPVNILILAGTGLAVLCYLFARRATELPTLDALEVYKHRKMSVEDREAVEYVLNLPYQTKFPKEYYLSPLEEHFQDC